MNGVEITRVLQDRYDFPREQASEIWSMILQQIRNDLVRGKSVALKNIGTLTPYNLEPSRYKHPTTGKLVDVPKRPHVRLVLSPSLKSDLREQN